MSELNGNSEYKFGRGGSESIRLTGQHHLFKARQGYLLHPTVAEGIKAISKPRIADIATGTGIWAIDVAEQLPHAEVTGLDISDQQFCPLTTLPSNVTLGIYDVLKDVPSEYRETFDVVHIRLLLVAGPTVDKAVLIDHFREMLRPGGWIQWDELSFPFIQVSQPIVSQDQAHKPRRGSGSSITVDHIEENPLMDHPLINSFTTGVNLGEKVQWIHDFETVMHQSGGFDECKRHSVPLQPHYLQMETDLVQASVMGMVDTMVAKKMTKDEDAARNMQDAMVTFNEDLKNGMLVSYMWNVCLARKT